MAKVELPRLKCLRCGHEWIPQQEEVTICPKCKTKHWDIPKTDRRGKRRPSMKKLQDNIKKKEPTTARL